MKKAMVMTVLGAMLGGGAIAQTTPSTGSVLSDLNGLQVLKTVAVERKLSVTDARLLALRSAPPADKEFTQLCLSKITYDALVVSANSLVARVLVTRAALESASCKTFSTSGVQGFINSGVLRPIVSAEDLSNFIKNPVLSGITDVNGVNATPSRP
jgi:hypothetical protein